MTDAELERLLAGLAADAPPPSPHFLERALAAALAEQPGARAPAQGGAPLQHGSNPVRARIRRWLHPLASGAGARAAVIGLAVVAVLGGVIGYADPRVVTEGLLAWPDPGLELVPTIEPFLAET